MIALLVAIPLALAFASVPMKKIGNYLLPIASLANVLLLLFMLKPDILLEIGGWEAAYGIAFVLDNASYPFLIFVNAMMLLVALSAKLEERFGTLLLVLLAALNGVLLTGDFFNSFVFLEIIAAVSYILASQNKNDYGAFKYLIFGGVAGVFYLIGTVMVYVKAGVLNMAYAGYIIDPAVVGTVSIFLLIGLLVELKILPLGLWAVDVYSNGSSLTPVVLGSTVTVSAVYLFSRVFINVLGFEQKNIVYMLALISIVLSQLGALKQKTLPRTLAYAVISGVSVVVAGLTTLDNNVLSASYFYLFNDAVSKFILFTISAYLGFKGFKEDKTSGVAFTIASLSLVGFPLLAGFWAKFYLLKSLFEIDNLVFPAVLLIATVIEAGYLIKWNVQLWFGNEESKASEKAESNDIEDLDSAEDYLPFASQLVIVLLAMVLLVAGFLPNIILDQTNIVSEHILNFSSYFDIIIKGGM